MQFAGVLMQLFSTYKIELRERTDLREKCTKHASTFGALTHEFRKKVLEPLRSLLE